ncbi:hypothetical protein BFW01_g11168 [Lasiodiplodia theobromae]|uniref:Redox protein fmp46 n=2 Tax=Lasiodiplodia TaxID=66739 RepID=A0A5N5DDE1_9PEZI|nr:Fatty acid desaturase [Lasiodiplodia theobromae]KAB2575705.1 hypothetical protein DBV05_g5593 [Lasiodiplodia theobromae]KAF4539547.1 Fatty acid desaturase [Lasiodiplodia theobromae]KAF9639362.1 hypothetical protein BFW01_g11168 [Lasiodiplodia theobromae]KAK0653822.1 hypothetical protein DIS24_g5828 [Lasiodiplodia hormozganensis]
MLPTLSRMGLLGKLFGEAGTKNIVTLFHNPASASSVRVLNLLKQAQANASTTTTIDQASDNSTQAKAEQAEFTFEAQEEPPTSDQVETILEYLGADSAGKVVQGATTQEEALKKFKMNANSFSKPLVVDWTSGKVVVGDNQSEILRLLGQSRSS